MRMSEDEFRRRFPNHVHALEVPSGTLVQRVGGLPKPVAEHRSRATAQGQARGQAAGEAGVGNGDAGQPGVGRSGPLARVAILRLYRDRRGKEFDRDNLIGGLKTLRDAIAATLGLDDADHLIGWEYHQMPTAGQPGTLVKIDLLA